MNNEIELKEVNPIKTMDMAKKLIETMEGLKYSEMLAALESAKGTISGILAVQCQVAGTMQMVKNMVNWKPGDE